MEGGTQRPESNEKTSEEGKMIMISAVAIKILNFANNFLKRYSGNQSRSKANQSPSMPSDATYTNCRFFIYSLYHIINNL